MSAAICHPIRVLGPILTPILTVLALSSSARADLLTSKNGDVEKGNELLAEGKSAEALEAYDEAVRKLPGSHAVHLNRGLALSRMGEEQMDQAMQAFQIAGEGGAPDDVRARALANLGNGFFKKEDFAKATELYKQSLALKPGNKDVAWNLELARQRKKEQDEQKKKEQEQNQQNQDQQNQDQQNQDQQNQDQQNQDQQNQDQQKQDQQNQDQQKQDQQKQDQQKQDQQKQDQQKQEQPQPKTKQEVEQVLDSLENKQDNLQKQMARQKGAVVQAGQYKDW